MQLQETLESSLGSSYTFERELGGGGMAHVFLARDREFGRAVVVKALAPEYASEIGADRFTRETRVAAGLQQANIVPVLSAGVVDGIPYYVMPFIDGRSLRHRLAAGPWPTLSESHHILNDVARALSYAHAHGVVHRDIKPENILLSQGTAVVSDFGIAKAFTAAFVAPRDTGTMTIAGMALGTPAYMSPEQAKGEQTDPRADIYSWGVVAYELLSGQHPFRECTTVQALVQAHIAQEPPPLRPTSRELAPALGRLVMTALQKDRGLRPATGAELCDALERVHEPSVNPRSLWWRARQAFASTYW